MDMTTRRRQRAWRRPVAMAATGLVAAAGALTLAATPAAAATNVPMGLLQPIETGFVVNGDVLTFGNGLLVCAQPNPSLPQLACPRMHNGTDGNNGYVMNYVDVDDDPTTFNSSSSTVTIPAGATVAKAWLFWSADGFDPETGGTAENAQCGGGASADPSYQLPRTPASIDDVVASDPQVSIDGGAYASAGLADYIAEVPANNREHSIRTHGAVEITDVLGGLGGGTHTITVGNVAGSQGISCAAGWAIHLAYDHGSFDPGDMDTAARKVYTSFGIDTGRWADQPQTPLVFDGFKTTTPGARVLVTATEGDNSDGPGFNEDFLVASWDGGSANVANALGQTVNVFRSHAENNVSFYPGVDTADFFNGSQDTFTSTIAGVPAGTTSIALLFRSAGYEGFNPEAVTLAVPVGAVMIDKTAPDGNDGQVLVPGGTPAYNITVTNAGAVPLQNVVVSDPLALACSVDGTPLTLTDDGFVVGSLPVQGEVLLECTGEPVASGDDNFVNTATVTGEDPTGDPVEPDSDDSAVFIGEIELTKTVSQPVVPIGGDVTWDIVVGNVGQTPIRDVELTDEDCTGTLEGPTGPGSDTGTLAPGDTWAYACTEPLEEGKVNHASVTGTPFVVVDGEEVTGPQVADEDDAEASVAGLALKKYTNGEDADEPTGPYVPVGDEVVWTYQVTNVGEVDLYDVVVTDDQGVVVPVTPTSGDTDEDGVLDVGEVWVFSATGTATAGQYANIGTATAAFDDDLDPETPPVPLAPVDDPSHYFGSAPAIDLVKTPDRTTAAPGDLVTYTFVATNTGNVELTDVVISEESFTGAGTVSDLACAPAQPAVLAPGASMTCTATYTVQAGDPATIDNVAVVTGEPPVGPPVTDRDDARVTTPPPAAPSSPSAPATPSSPSVQLPRTGAAIGLAGLGALILVAGGVTALTVRRRTS